MESSHRPSSALQDILSCFATRLGNPQIHPLGLSATTFDHYPELQSKSHTHSHHSTVTCRTQACPSKRWHRIAITNLDNPQVHSLGPSATILGGCGRQHTLSLAPYCPRLQRIRSLGLSAIMSSCSSDHLSRWHRTAHDSPRVHSAGLSATIILQLRLVVSNPSTHFN